jgi:hypothetical protein
MSCGAFATDQGVVEGRTPHLFLAPDRRERISYRGVPAFVVVVDCLTPVYRSNDQGPIALTRAWIVLNRSSMLWLNLLPEPTLPAFAARMNETLGSASCSGLDP